ncbi:MAG: hypothetical protein RI883_625 [Bacteroidota bacterium]|jgi:hypothetical protein
MKKFALILFLFVSTIGFGQTKNLHLTNALVIGQMDKEEDRYALEVNLTELLTDAGIKAIPSLNIMKLGSDASILATDSIQKIVAARGVDTYVLISIRGYDKKYRISERNDDVATALNAGNLFPLYRDEITSVSFEFLFYRNGQFVGSDIVKCGNISDRDSVIKRFRNNLTKQIVKKWK